MGRGWIFMALFAAATAHAQTYTVGGSISGYIGSGLQMQLNYADCLGDGQTFTLNSTSTNDCFTTDNRAMCCSDSIKFTAFDGLHTVSCTCGTTVITRPEFGGGGEVLTVAKNATSYEFSPVTPAVKFTVIVAAMPTNPRETCVVQNATGIVDGGNVTNVNVVCTDRIFANGFN